MGLTLVIQRGYDGYAGGESGQGGPKLISVKQGFTYTKGDTVGRANIIYA